MFEVEEPNEAPVPRSQVRRETPVAPTPNPKRSPGRRRAARRGMHPLAMALSLIAGVVMALAVVALIGLVLLLA